MTAPFSPSQLSQKQGGHARGTPTLSRVLWAIQGLLALEFLLTGGTKLLLPLAALEAQMPVPLPGLFVRFLGVCEVLGALGLILPALLRIRPQLTPIAAAGLVIIMAGATAFTLRWEPAAEATLPFVTGLLAAFVAYGRWRLVPVRGPSRLPRSQRSPTRG
jgi:uncharacterized membrane protein YphA (DoxX/SURF4 family)